MRGDFVAPLGAGPFPGICDFHGLPGSCDHVSGIASRLALSGFLVLTFDFRGFRRSGGLFRLSGEIEDAERAVTHLLQSELSLKRWVGVYGGSYGGAVAICSAARDDRISCVCVRAPVYDTLTFARSPIIQLAVEEVLKEDPESVHGLTDSRMRNQMLQWMIEDAARFNPMNDVAKISPRPLLVITGDADPLIDLTGVRRLLELAKEPKDFVVVTGADHELTDPVAYETTINRVVSWFENQRPR